MEHAEHAQHAAGINKKIALLIAIMALFLAFSGMLGKSANTEALNLNILASDTWAFFQAKTIRRTTLSNGDRSDDHGCRRAALAAHQSKHALDIELEPNVLAA